LYENWQTRAQQNMPIGHITAALEEKENELSFSFSLAVIKLCVSGAAETGHCGKNV
jgi:hypothetical protein